MTELFDFGFTLVTEEELPAPAKVVEEAENLQTDLLGKDQELFGEREKLADMHGAIQGLLDNLKKNPEKDYILWPNRLEKVEEFEQILIDIYERPITY